MDTGFTARLAAAKLEEMPAGMKRLQQLLIGHALELAWTKSVTVGGATYTTWSGLRGAIASGDQYSAIQGRTLTDPELFRPIPAYPVLQPVISYQSISYPREVITVIPVIPGIP